MVAVKVATATEQAGNSTVQQQVPQLLGRTTQKISG